MVKRDDTASMHFAVLYCILFTSLGMTMKIHIYRNKALVHGIVQSWSTIYDSILLVSCRMKASMHFAVLY